jgi:hypothetical protein
MTDNLAYLGRNLDGRTKKAVEDFELEVSRVMRQAAAAGALNSSRTFIEFWNAGVAVLERELNDAIQFAYNATGENTGKVYDQVALCSKQMLERIMQDVRKRAAVNDSAFGGGYAEIVDRMLSAMNEKRDRLLEDFKHGMMGSQKLRKDPVVSIVAKQTGSPGSIQQVGVGKFSQSAFIQNHQPLIDEINKVLASDEFTALKPAEQEGVRDIADIVKAEAEKPEPDVGKLKRWGGRLVDLTADVGLKVVSGTIAGLLLKMYGGG